MLEEWLRQAGQALAYYATLVVIMRISGKRLAGQMQTLDLIILITLGVVLQQTALEDGTANAVVFVVTVFCAHRGLNWLTLTSPAIRRAIRGRPRALVREGRVIDTALEHEGVSRDELLAGLRKLGYDSPAKVRLAVLEETGAITAIERES
ncbi:MAG: DUF421 domain-containing protein [Steroidobacteraceae bacterium]|jgi:uncharacterized membrane protein YcaP (DUF421 family)|nr:DUF421 domain-containing protein [Steroidobacteraceae bacterium]